MQLNSDVAHYYNSNEKQMKKALTKNQISALSEYLSILRTKFREKIVDVLLFEEKMKGPDPNL